MARKDLRDRGYPLSEQIWSYLKRDAQAGAHHSARGSGFDVLVDRYLRLMADEVAIAIEEGKNLRLGCL